jgi:glyoxylase-like metal-dependent hydrolase (beta-lactamase superfamily II)
MNMNSRRGFLKLAAGGATGVALWSSGAASAAWAKADPVAGSPLGDGISLITGGGANVVAFRGTDGLLLIDGGTAASSGDVLRVALQATGTRTLHTLFNTHWHPEQTGLNERAGREGARIIAHENTRLWLTRRISTEWLPKGYGPFAPKSLPNKSFYTKESLDFGGETFDYGHLGQAHTDGDLYVFLRKANLLVAGGVVSAAGWPVMDWRLDRWPHGRL